MTRAGLLFMVIAWVSIIVMTIFSFRRVLMNDADCEDTDNKS